MIEGDIFGHIGGIIVAIALLPQIIKSWRTKSTEDISYLWNIILIVGLFFWVLWGIVNRLLPPLIFASLEMFFAITLIVMKLIYERKKK